MGLLWFLYLCVLKNHSQYKWERTAVLIHFPSLAAILRCHSFWEAFEAAVQGVKFLFTVQLL